MQRMVLKSFENSSEIVSINCVVVVIDHFHNNNNNKMQLNFASNYAVHLIHC